MHTVHDVQLQAEAVHNCTAVEQLK